VEGDFLEAFGEKYGVTLMFLIPIAIFTVAFTDHFISYIVMAIIFAIFSFIIEKNIKEKHEDESKELVNKRVGNIVIPAVFVFMIVNLIIVFI